MASGACRIISRFEAPGGTIGSTFVQERALTSLEPSATRRGVRLSLAVLRRDSRSLVLPEIRLLWRTMGEAGTGLAVGLAVGLELELELERERGWAASMPCACASSWASLGCNANGGAMLFGEEEVWLGSSRCRCVLERCAAMGPRLEGFTHQESIMTFTQRAFELSSSSRHLMLVHGFSFFSERAHCSPCSLSGAS